VIQSIMDPRLQADEFMEQLLAAHQAEDAFVPAPEDLDRVPADAPEPVGRR
jgi:hypothetical protein